MAYGLLVQLVVEGRSAAFLSEFKGFYQRLGLPLKLADLGLTGDVAAALALIAERTIAEAPYIRQIEAELDGTKLKAALERVEAGI